MAELVDALVSGTSILLDVQVRVLFWAHLQIQIKTKALKFNNLSAFVLRGHIKNKIDDAEGFFRITKVGRRIICIFAVSPR